MIRLSVLYKTVLLGGIFICFFFGGVSFVLFPKAEAPNVITEKTQSRELLDADSELADFVGRAKRAFSAADKVAIEALFNRSGIGADEEDVIALKTKEILQSPYLDRIGSNIERIDDYSKDAFGNISQIRKSDIEAGDVPKPLNMVPIYILEVVLEEVSENSTISYHQLIGRTKSGEFKFASYVPLSVCTDTIYHGPEECSFY